MLAVIRIWCDKTGDRNKRGVFWKHEREGLIIFFLFSFVKTQLTYNAVPISAVEQSDPVKHIYTFPSHIIFHHGLAKETGYSALGYTAGPHCLSIRNGIVFCFFVFFLKWNRLHL